MATKQQQTALLAILRTLFEVAAAASMVFWACFSFALPWPGIGIAVAVAVAAILVWALFLSPKPVLLVDRYARTLLGMVFIAVGAAAALASGAFWLAILIFAVLAFAVTFWLAARGGNQLD